MPNVTQKTEDNKNILPSGEDVLNVIRSKIEQRFNALREQAQNTTNIWERYDIDCALKELKYVYEQVLKGE